MLFEYGDKVDVEMCGQIEQVFNGLKDVQKVDNVEVIISVINMLNEVLYKLVEEVYKVSSVQGVDFVVVVVVVGVGVVGGLMFVFDKDDDVIDVEFEVKDNKQEIVDSIVCELCCCVIL